MKKRLPWIQESRTGVKSFTLIEILFVVALVAVLLAVVYPYFRAMNVGWQSVDRRAEVIQNARVGMDKMVCILREATGFTSVTAAGDADGRIVFLDKDGDTKEFKKYNDGVNDMLGYVRGGSTSELAGPIASLKFTGYESDGVTTTVVAANIRSVEMELIVSDSEGEVSDQTITSRASYRND